MAGVCVLVCVCLSTGQGESTEATGARCDDRRSLGLKIALCSQRRETEEGRKGGGGGGGPNEQKGSSMRGGEGKSGEMEGGPEVEEGEVIENNVSELPGEGELTS